MVDMKSIQEQKDNMFMMEGYVIPFLNQFEVIDCSTGGQELEYVLIENTKENVEKLNEFLCTVNNWAMVSPMFLCPVMNEFLRHCRSEGEDTLDLAYLVYNYLNIKTDWLWFGTEKKEWVIRY